MLIAEYIRKRLEIHLPLGMGWEHYIQQRTDKTGPRVQRSRRFVRAPRFYRRIVAAWGLFVGSQPATIALFVRNAGGSRTLVQLTVWPPALSPVDIAVLLLGLMAIGITLYYLVNLQNRSARKRTHRGSNLQGHGPGADYLQGSSSRQLPGSEFGEKQSAGDNMEDREHSTMTIGRLPELLAALPPDRQVLVKRLFQIVSVTGEAILPPAMEQQMVDRFGSVERVRHQPVIRVMNRWTFEGATFNPLRALRPGARTMQQASAVPAEVITRIEERRGKDDFCDLYQRTPADTFGRVESTFVRTASNLAKADGWHGVGIFREHDPLAINQELVADIFAVSAQWAQRAYALDGRARYFFLYWNCLPRAGASIIHGHVQMTLSQEMAQAKVEGLCAAAERYKHETGGEYFTDLIAAHRALGLVLEDSPGSVRFASLTPVKEREVIHLALAPDQVSWRDGLSMLGQSLAATLHTMMHDYGVLAFNVAVFGPPIDGLREGDERWRSFPFMARFVDRGNPVSEVSDIASMELFGSSVIASDPFDVARRLGGEA